jgi:hypothetical protein
MNSPENVRGNIRISDITRPLNFGKYDLVISSEVAEHLPHNSALVFVNNLVSHAKDMVFFTAAEPGQGAKGDRHINEQPREYWIAEFNKRGFVFLSNESSAFSKYLRSQWERRNKAPRHFIFNIMILRKAEKATSFIIHKQLEYSKIGFALKLYLLRHLINARPKAFMRGFKLFLFFLATPSFRRARKNTLES